MATIPPDVREFVKERAKRQCEYCQTQERVVIYLEIDHIIPQSKGGASQPNNLCYACRNCNTAKHNHLTGVDPVTGQAVTLFNPRTQVWTDHFRWSPDGTTLIGITATGRATIERLLINIEPNRAARRLWVSVGWHPPQD